MHSLPFLQPRRFIRLLLAAMLVVPALSFRGDLAGKDLTVSYSIKVSTRRGDAGKGETYNGGIQTLFISEGLVRLRLVSLMRTQSIFILPGSDPGQTAAVVRESGKTKYKYYLSSKDWILYNESYKDATCRFDKETTTLLNYPCQKATITLKDGRILTLYYTTAVRNAGLAAAEPVFSCIPGLVLKYEYSYKKGTITYTATHIDHGRINPDVFKVPSRGYTLKEYSPGQETKTRRH
ncbi:MAG: hypothetical protein P4L51_03275 [Puia sp.]|nr:hypothetical protein [Puia sp.]